MISMSSGVALYAAATLLKLVSCVTWFWYTRLNSPGVCSAKVYSNNDSVRRDLDAFLRITIAIDDRRRS
jgi:hypothetical protein